MSVRDQRLDHESLTAGDCHPGAFPEISRDTLRGRRTRYGGIVGQRPDHESLAAGGFHAAVGAFPEISRGAVDTRGTALVPARRQSE